MSNKLLYTKIFLKQSDKSINEVSVKEHLSLWWQNTRSKEQGGLRLTDEGFRFIVEELNLQTYDIPYPQDFELTTNTIIWLDNFIDCPYFLSRKGIVVTNEKKAVELSLFSGDVRKYGLTKALNKQKNS
jgi:hypothetical protein